MKYVSPVAELVALEAVSVILASTTTPCIDDGPCYTYDSGCSDEGMEF